MRAFRIFCIFLRFLTWPPLSKLLNMSHCSSFLLGGSALRPQSSPVIHTRCRSYLRVHRSAPRRRPSRGSRHARRYEGIPDSVATPTTPTTPTDYYSFILRWWFFLSTTKFKEHRAWTYSPIKFTEFEYSMRIRQPTSCFPAKVRSESDPGRL